MRLSRSTIQPVRSLSIVGLVDRKPGQSYLEAALNNAEAGNPDRAATALKKGARREGISPLVQAVVMDEAIQVNKNQFNEVGLPDDIANRYNKAQARCRRIMENGGIVTDEQREEKLLELMGFDLGKLNKVAEQSRNERR